MAKIERRMLEDFIHVCPPFFNELFFISNLNFKYGKITELNL